MKVSAEKAWKAYQKNLKGLPENKQNPNRMTKSQFISSYNKRQKTRRTSQVESGLKQAGLSYKEIARLKGKR